MCGVNEGLKKRNTTEYILVCHRKGKDAKPMNAGPDSPSYTVQAWGGPAILGEGRRCFLHAGSVLGVDEVALAEGGDPFASQAVRRLRVVLDRDRCCALARVERLLGFEGVRP